LDLQVSLIEVCCAVDAIAAGYGDLQLGSVC